ncbi:TIGR02391 family protein [Nakamurella multipartita]|uniref:TIGR02391 family protein n=1 Tax=Nakamurella multipartita TaxID=53461 RepID=UPI000694DDDD|nr:TIGR02391 family protein [Nakamurella multipartita]
MDAKRAAEALRDLKSWAETDDAIQRETPQHTAWKAKVQGVLDRSLGHEASTTKEFRELRYFVGVWSGAIGEAERDAQYFRGRVHDAMALIEAAIYELEVGLHDETIDSGSFDAGLWDHVKHNVEEERWDQVASAAVIYTEDKVRRWSCSPTDRQGRKVTGKDLFVRALAADGPLPLGSQPNEQDGWRNLGTGLVAALGNVDRHNIQERDDLRRYAMGVVGLASLLLTQIRYQHPGAVR